MKAHIQTQTNIQRKKLLMYISYLGLSQYYITLINITYQNISVHAIYSKLMISYILLKKDNTKYKLTPYARNSSIHMHRKWKVDTGEV